MSARKPILKAARRAKIDALRDMSRGGARPIDLRQLPGVAGVLKSAVYGART